METEEENRKENGKKIGKKTGRNDDRGVIMVEASVLVPVILFLTAGIILTFLLEMKREMLRDDMVVSLYTIPVSEELDKSPENELERRAESLGGKGESVVGEFRDGRMILTGTTGMKEILGRPFEFTARAARDRDVCSDRLRRWQFYGDITEE